MMILPCNWCAEDLTYLATKENNEKIVICPICGNTFLVRYEFHYYSYILEKCVGSKPVSAIWAEKK